MGLLSEVVGLLEVSGPDFLKHTFGCILYSGISQCGLPEMQTPFYVIKDNQSSASSCCINLPQNNDTSDLSNQNIFPGPNCVHTVGFYCILVIFSCIMMTPLAHIQISVQEKDSSAIQTILDEIKNIQRLQHENIVKFYGVEIHHVRTYSHLHCNHK